MHAIVEMMGHRKFGALVEYNDAAERTQADVLALFDRAIAAVEARVTEAAQ